MTTMTAITPDDFMRAAPRPYNGNTPWAERYAREIRRIIVEYSARRPRNMQKNLGPSEIGSPCDAQVIGKMAGLPTTNHIFDPWPSFVGTAVHAELAQMFEWYNVTYKEPRFVTEQRVEPVPGLRGTGDLLDFIEMCVDDHKVLGESTLQKVKRPEGPPIKYKVQMLLYALGFRRLGIPVKRVALIAYPRTESTLDGMYVWEQLITAETDALVTAFLERTEIRKALAEFVASGHLSITDVPRTPSDDECYFCPFYRAQSAHDGGVGCPGNRAPGAPFNQ